MHPLLPEFLLPSALTRWCLLGFLRGNVLCGIEGIPRLFVEFLQQRHIGGLDITDVGATQTDSLCQGELTDTSQLSVIGDIQADHFIFFFPSEHFRHTIVAAKRAANAFFIFIESFLLLIGKKLSVIGDIQADHFIFFFPSEHFRHLFRILISYS